jgi:hypothetical protein
MKILLFGLILSSNTYAHKMTDLIKKTKIVEAVRHLKPNIKPHDIEMSLPLHAFGISAMYQRLSNSADLDFDAFSFKVSASRELSCDIITGEYVYMDGNARYFLIFKNCIIQDDSGDKYPPERRLENIVWDDSQYN